MPTGPPNTLRYQRAHFVTHLPLDFLYSPAHAWIARRDATLWRVGLTPFATRMLGELADYQFTVAPGTAVRPGQVLGWIEGFKAVSELGCIAEGHFAGANPALQEQLTLVTRDPYGAGWLYEVRGQPDRHCCDARSYAALLDRTIDRLAARRQADPPP